MKFYLFEPNQSYPTSENFPYVVLTWNNWDDYGYKTSFEVEVHLSKDERINLGLVKILNKTQTQGRTPISKSEFTKLGSKYCSLGPSLEYYERVFKFGPMYRKKYLEGLRDVVFDDAIQAAFEDLEGYQVSLLRFSGSQRMIADAERLFRQPIAPRLQRRRGFSLKFKTQLSQSSDPVVVEFDFNRKGSLPNRINALIGYNGTGKTVLLSNLATLVSEYGYDTKEDRVANRAGRFVGQRPRIVRVIVVSYSAFDTFVIPEREEAERVGYIYCGLRDQVRPQDRNSPNQSYRLKSPQDLENEFTNTIDRIEKQDRSGELNEALIPLIEDASFRRIGLTMMLERDDYKNQLLLFRSLSSGHKIVLKIVSELVAYMDGTDPTLVLIDELETHLHPPLVASLLRSVRECLSRLNGFAIVATHSPVVLQELPARYVRVLRRSSERSQIAHASLETFGESIGRITEHVFNLDDTATDWHRTLKELAMNNSMDEIESMFGNDLSFSARSFVASSYIESNEK